MKQLVLGISLREHSDFANFKIGDKNQELVAALKKFSAQSVPAVMLLHGEKQTGRSHLLEASCAAASELGVSTAYLPMQELQSSNPVELLEGLDAVDLLAIDDLDLVLHDEHWAKALFHLYNRGQQNKQRLLCSAAHPPAQLQVALPDLQSRLSAALVYHVAALNDEERKDCLIQRAHLLGFVMNDDVANYVLARAERSMGNLLRLLHVLDQETLVHQRRLTVPFVKSVMDW
ncbi:MAG: DnaA regulatory inactivator Hda [Pseudomonadales bacterium]